MGELNFIFRGNLKRLRKAAGFSQAAYAEAVDVSGKTVKTWEGGSGFPEMAKLEILAKPLNVQAYELLLPEEADSPLTISEALQKVKRARECLQEAESYLEDLLTQKFNEQDTDNAEAVLGDDDLPDR